MNASSRRLVILWLAWALLVIGFQALVAVRFKPQRPDTVLDWPPSETGAASQNDQRYLSDLLMNHQVSWDSEFYLSIATVGYDDPAVRTAPPLWRPEIMHDPVSLNYAFFPLYPYAMRVVSLPLRLLGLTPIATSTLAGVVVSLLGTLGGVLALYDLTYEKLEETGGIRPGLDADQHLADGTAGDAFHVRYVGRLKLNTPTNSASSECTADG